MKFHLYHADLEVAGRADIASIIAPSPERAKDVLDDHFKIIGKRYRLVELKRIDHHVRDGYQRLGLDNMLRHAPIGFASFADGLGWVAHAAAIHRLRFFKITAAGEDDMFVLAPSPETAVAQWRVIRRVPMSATRDCYVEDAMPLLTGEQAKALEPFLEFGPAGAFEWTGERWR